MLTICKLAKDLLFILFMFFMKSSAVSTGYFDRRNLSPKWFAHKCQFYLKVAMKLGQKVDTHLLWIKSHVL